MKRSAELRSAFLDYFTERGHAVVDSSPLVPGNDPTLLFTNAGMVQFKDTFLGREKRPYTRAVSSQRCVRAGGKHNDLENVGYTARHHTFFEMLGNFSFGDYFKREAIGYAWEFLTEVLGLPPERLWVTVYTDDKEAERIWLDEIQIAPTRFSRCGEKDNFWSMGETGPCGPCSEIFYDHGPAVSGGPPGSPDEDGDRYVEVWNLVFMQYDRDANGKLTPLPRPSVDTGMGLERLAAVMQGVHSNYEIDLFQTLIKAAAAATGCDDLQAKSLRVISDHIRSAAFLVVDGVTPGNEGRGYVQRRVIRRAIRHGYQLGCTEPFFYKLVQPLVDEMGAAYPELTAKQTHVEQVLRAEEERFADTLDQGLKVFEGVVAELSNRVIPGEAVFRLYDTYGFPADLTADIARERGLSLDMAGFEREMGLQKERARAASQFGAGAELSLDIEGQTDFTGYDDISDEGTVIALYKNDLACDRLRVGEQGIVVLDVTPFYAESGGQVGDRGELSTGSAGFTVEDTQKYGDGIICHVGRVSRGELQVGDSVEARVDGNLRRATALHHSATHLLHAALRQVLGDHVQQRGSLVGPDRLRFDFTHFEPVTSEQRREIERLVNREIRENHTVETRIMGLDDAKASGAMALFGEKYGEQVRVLRMGGFSTELCGGTHVRAVGDIGLFKVTSEGGISSGTRRIEAVAGERALDFVDEEEGRLARIAELVRGASADADAKVAQLVERSRSLEKELEQLKARLASAAGTDLADKTVEIDGIRVLAARLDGADPKSLRDTMDQLKNKVGSGVVLLATEAGGKVNLIAGVTKDLTDRFKAGDLVKAAAEKVGGRGGGRPDMAQAGGTDPAGIPAALALVGDWVRERAASTAA
jgi:alanyl-tRNA synthetase